MFRPLMWGDSLESVWKCSQSGMVGRLFNTSWSRLVRPAAKAFISHAIARRPTGIVWQNEESVSSKVLNSCCCGILYRGKFANCGSFRFERTWCVSMGATSRSNVECRTMVNPSSYPRTLIVGLHFSEQSGGVRSWADCSRAGRRIT